MCSWMQRGTQAAAAVVVAGVLAGCGAAPTSLTELNTSYELALERTAPLAVFANVTALQRFVMLARGLRGDGRG